jgi:hypothetical protein
VKTERPNIPLTIANLVRTARPVSPLRDPSTRAARWVVAAAALMLWSVGILGPRADIAAHLMDGGFLARATATLAVAIAAAVLAFVISVPGVEPSLRLRAWALLACVVWPAILIITIATTGPPLELVLHVTPHPACVLRIAAAAVAPWILLVHMLRLAAPLQPRRTGGLAGLASLALGAIGAQLVCIDDGAAHQLLWHFTPVVLLTIATFSFGSLVFDTRHPQPL